MNTSAHYRMMIYSHDTFGLGHLRRARRIAHKLVESYHNLSILIVSGSPMAGSFSFKAGVDFVRVPGVLKQSDGTYATHNLGLPFKDVMRIREKLILKSAQVFKPHLFLVDKEPWGMGGELKSTLAFLKDKNAHLVLGLRDVLDDPEVLKIEWARKKAVDALEDFYDDLWIYGPESLYNPLQGLDVSSKVASKIRYTGYLSRPVYEAVEPYSFHKFSGQDPFIVVTTGGGGDGDAMIDAVLNVYHYYENQLPPALIVLGPFMTDDARAKAHSRAALLKKVELIDFEKNLDALMMKASGIVAMGGYNTFCEMLAANKPCLLIPRTVPRKEQLIRATNAQKLGIVRMMTTLDAGDENILRDALKTLIHQNKPSDVTSIGELCHGLDRITEYVKNILPDLRVV